MTSLESFHFLRPLWLLATIPAAGLLFLLWRRQSGQGWRRLIAPHLLEPLTVRTGETDSRLGPGTLLAVFWLLAIVAVAGPSWQREPSPFADETSAIVLALYLGPTMDAQDIQPSRLERGVHKIRDLLALRRGAPTALIAYAGTAHTVLPFTTDQKLVEQMAAELETGIMPREGNAPEEAMRLAVRLLEQAELSGHVLLITDSILPESIEALSDTKGRAEILALAAPPDAPPPTVGPPAPALDRPTLERAARALGGSLVEVAIDDGDVERLARRLERQVATGASREQVRWQDAGHALTFPIALILLLGARRGFHVRWEG